MTIYSQVNSNKAKSFVIFGLFIVLISGFFYLIGLYYGDGSRYFLMGLLFASFSSIFSYFYSDKLVLMSVRAHPADKKKYFDFYTVSHNLAIAGGIPVPKLYVVDDPAPNAFATGRDPKHAVICATTGLLSVLDRSELEGVIAHELSHVKNYDMLVMTVVSVLVGTISLVADWVMRSFWWNRRDDDREGNRNPALFVFLIIALILAPLAATLIQLAISRKREFLADASGALLTRYPEGLARALEKIGSYPRSLTTATTATAHLFISNPFKKDNKGSWLTNLFSTHPPIEERIKILRSL